MSSAISQWTNKPINHGAARLLYQFPYYVFLENIAVRSNGHLLLTCLSEPSVYNYDPANPTTAPSKIASFPSSECTVTSGITELSPDLFVVSTSVIIPEAQAAEPGSTAAWTLDFRSGAESPVVKKIVQLVEAQCLNGMTAVPGSPRIALFADSYAGAVYRLDVETGEYGIVVRDELMADVEGNGAGVAINGVRVRDGHLYWVNSVGKVVARVQIDERGEKAGKVEVLARLPADSKDAWDDLAVDGEGCAWVMRHPGSVDKVVPDGEVRVVAGEHPEFKIDAPTSAQFGRGSEEQERTLYVVTGGTYPSPGQIIAIDTAMI